MEKTDVVFNSTGLYGAVTGTAALILTYLNFRRNRAIVCISVHSDMEVIGDSVYKPKTSYVKVNVANVGQRQLTLTLAGYSFLKGNGAVIADSLRAGASVIQEGESIDFLVEQDLVKMKEISYFWVKDATGKEHRKNIAKAPIRLWFWLLKKMGKT